MCNNTLTKYVESQMALLWRRHGELRAKGLLGPVSTHFLVQVIKMNPQEQV